MQTRNKKRRRAEAQAMGIKRQYPLTAKMEPFDSYWEGPSDVEKGYGAMGQFYKANYRMRLPNDRDARILVVSCGPGYFVDFLTREGYRNVMGIDSDPGKVSYAQARGLACVAGEAFAYIAGRQAEFDVIFCESEINHLTMDEILLFLHMCRDALKPGGAIILHSMNGANPVTGAEGLALNMDHFNTFTEYSLRQALSFSGFRGVQVFPLKLYVFYRNPLNYVGLAVETALTAAFRALFIFYGKDNRIFTKKLAAIGRRGAY